jgi:hypothetical protein
VPGTAVVAPSWAAIGGRALRGHEKTKAAALAVLVANDLLAFNCFI